MDFPVDDRGRHRWCLVRQDGRRKRRRERDPASHGEWTVDCGRPVQAPKRDGREPGAGGRGVPRLRAKQGDRGCVLHRARSQGYRRRDHRSVWSGRLERVAPEDGRRPWRATASSRSWSTSTTPGTSTTSTRRGSAPSATPPAGMPCCSRRRATESVTERPRRRTRSRRRTPRRVPRTSRGPASDRRTSSSPSSSADTS